MPRDTLGPGSDLAADVPNAELGYAEKTNDQTGMTVEADVTGLSITFVAGTKPVWLEAMANVEQLGGAAGLAVLIITDGSNAVQAKHPVNLASTAFENLNPKRRLTLTPGTSYTFKVRATTSAGTLSIFGAATNTPAFIRAVEVQN